MPTPRTPKKKPVAVKADTAPVPEKRDDGNSAVPVLPEVPHERREIRRCEEFVLYEKTVIEEGEKGSRREGKKRKVKVLEVESSPDVELAMKRACFSTSSRAGAEGRLKMKLALWGLMEDAAGHFMGDRESLLDDLSETLGQTLLDALNKADGAEKRARIVVKKVTAAASDVEAAITQMVKYRGYRPMPGDKTRGAWTWILQLEAKDIFRETLSRPTQSEIWARLDDEEWSVGVKDRPERQRMKMEQAGLGKLPP